MPEEIARDVDREINARFEQALAGADTEEKRKFVLGHREFALYVAVRKILNEPHGIPGVVLFNLSMLDSSEEAQRDYLREAVRTDPKKDKLAPQLAKVIAIRMSKGLMPEAVLDMAHPGLMEMVDDALTEDVVSALTGSATAKKKSPPKPA